jgi:hypothetical protein
VARIRETWNVCRISGGKHLGNKSFGRWKRGLKEIIKMEVGLRLEGVWNWLWILSDDRL